MQDNSTTITDKSFCTEEKLREYLRNKSSFSAEEQKQLKYFIDNFSDCWKTWNKVRWDEAMNTEGMRELKEYLGDEFVPYYDSSWGLAEEWNSKKRDSKESIEEFYKHTKNYIYNSMVFYHSGDRADFHKYLKTLITEHKIRSVTDYGCGVGNDGLQMLKEGVEVHFVDFASPTLDFLRWRLKHRNCSSDRYKVIEVGGEEAEDYSSDMFWSVDVIEHMVNPLEIFNYIQDSTKLVVYFTDSDDEAGGRHPFHFKINEDLLVQELTRRGFEKINHPVLNVWLNVSGGNK